ncbi:hypothetical protein Tco_0954629 [Tanacetum coccineum]|uniref:Uncharacterized protein n=1 Tax=Tanacetum coccineum TaxID=301880 RepID=A0ABQ5E4Y7_9ASTR
MDSTSSSSYMQQPLPNNNNYNPQPSFNQNYMQQLMLNPKDITDPTTAMNMTLVLMAKAFKLNYSITQTIHNQQTYTDGWTAIGGNQFSSMLGQEYWRDQEEGYNASYKLVLTNQNQNGNGNVVAAHAEGNANGNNGNQIRCYNCRGWVIFLGTTQSDQREGMLLIFILSC